MTISKNYEILMKNYNEYFKLRRTARRSAFPSGTRPRAPAAPRGSWPRPESAAVGAGSRIMNYSEKYTEHSEIR